MGAAEALAQDKPAAVEKPNLKIGFIPITCASPIIMAQPMGFYSKYGLNAEVIKTAGWAIIRDKSLNREYDASHMLSPMPIAISMGIGSVKQDWQIPAIENINGQAIVLALKHKDRRDPKTWKGLRFGIPFDYFHAQLPAALLPGRGRHRPRHRRAAPRDPAPRDGRQPARRQYRRLPRARTR